MYLSLCLLQDKRLIQATERKKEKVIRQELKAGCEQGNLRPIRRTGAAGGSGVVILMTHWLQKNFASAHNSPHFADEGAQIRRVDSLPILNPWGRGSKRGKKQAENELSVTEAWGLKVQKVTHSVQ